MNNSNTGQLQLYRKLQLLQYSHNNIANRVATPRSSLESISTADMYATPRSSLEKQR